MIEHVVGVGRVQWLEREVVEDEQVGGLAVAELHRLGAVLTDQAGGAPHQGGDVAPGAADGERHLLGQTLRE